MITSQESHTPCTLAPQPQAAQLTLHRDRVHIWSPLRSWVGTQEMHRNPHIWMQLIPSHHFLQLWLVPTCHSRAVSPAPTPGLCLELLTVQTPSEKWCLTLQTQKHNTKTFFSWLSSPASPTSDPHGNLTTEQLLHGAREMLALPSLGAEHHPRSHTHNLGTWDWAKFCALGWLNLQKSSPKQAKLDKFCNICFKPFSFTSQSELIS